MTHSLAPQLLEGSPHAFALPGRPSAAAAPSKQPPPGKGAVDDKGAAFVVRLAGVLKVRGTGLRVVVSLQTAAREDTLARA